MRSQLSDSHRRIFDVVARIPRGRVMTYGQVAEAAALRGAARLVGYAMHALGAKLPWHRVLGARRAGLAQVSIRDPQVRGQQRLLLEREGVVFSASGAVDLTRFGAAGDRRKPAKKR